MTRLWNKKPAINFFFFCSSCFFLSTFIKEHAFMFWFILHIDRVNNENQLESKTNVSSFFLLTHTETHCNDIFSLRLVQLIQFTYSDNIITLLLLYSRCKWMHFREKKCSENETEMKQTVKRNEVNRPTTNIYNF